LAAYLIFWGSLNGKRVRAVIKMEELMKLPTSYVKAFLSLVLAVTVTSVFSLRSFAASETKDSLAGPVAQDCSGTLTVKGGSVTINGNPAQTGATVMTGSVISTGSGAAVIDMGPAGRVEVGDHTTATIICVGGSIEVRTNCSKTKVEVKRGQVDVKTPKVETLPAGKSETYSGGIDATAPAGVDMEVECVGKKAAGAYASAGLIGLLALIGVGAAVAIGVGVSDNDSDSRSSSPAVP
jgi:ribosomal 50S subunit-recycling heat shock protein